MRIKIQGWFDSQNLYTRMAKQYSKGKFVEIGAWRGQSSAFMLDLIKVNSLTVTFDIVDNFLGSPEHSYQIEEVKKAGGSIFKQFKANIKAKGTWNYINKIHILDSVDASALYKDEALDFVYIDGSHLFKQVLQDLNNWYPKLKIGGTIGGDDYYSWKGVKKAVDQFFNKQEIKFSGAHTWEVIKREG